MHVFYALCCGVDAATRTALDRFVKEGVEEALVLGDVLPGDVTVDAAAAVSLPADCSRFRLLLGGGPLSEDEAAAHAAQFETLRDAMQRADVTSAEAMDVYRVLVAILHLGNVVFTSDSSSGVDVAALADKTDVVVAAALLGVRASQLLTALVNTYVAADGGELMFVALSGAKAADAVVQVVHVLFEQLLAWLTARLNVAVIAALQQAGVYCDERAVSRYNVHSGGDSASAIDAPQCIVDVVDSVGFEGGVVAGAGPVTPASVDTLLRNTWCEQARQLFIQTVLRKEEQQYAAEGATVAAPAVADNAVTLEVLEGASAGLLPLLDASLTRRRQSMFDAVVAEEGGGGSGGGRALPPVIEFLRRNTASGVVLVPSRPGSDGGESGGNGSLAVASQSFAIRHSVCDVAYDGSGFAAAFRATARASSRVNELCNLFRNSRVRLCSHMLSAAPSSLTQQQRLQQLQRYLDSAGDGDGGDSGDGGDGATTAPDDVMLVCNLQF
jgi:hypothetical protein